MTVVLGEIKRSDLLGVELCIISPGIPLDSPFVAVVDDAKIPILGEIELAYQCGLGKLAAITGTNGKTTTTALTGEILKARYEETFVVGNIGDPYTSKVLEMTEDSVDRCRGIQLPAGDHHGFQAQCQRYFKHNPGPI